MTVDEQRLRQSLHTRLAELVGTEETALLMHYLPPVGWADVATKGDLDALRADLHGEMVVLRSEMDVLRSELRREMTVLRSHMDVLRSELGGAVKAQTTRILLWLVPSVIAGIGVASQLG